MTWRDLRLRLRALVAPQRTERELDEELAFHLEMEARKLEAAGLDPVAARARARARFGSTARAADECREARGTMLLETLARDAAYAVRGFRRAPGTAATIVSTVALGLGLVGAVFTIFNHFVFRVDAVQDPASLYEVRYERPATGGRGRPFTRPQYEALLRETDVFSDAFARLLDVTTRVDGRMVEIHLVTGNFFELLGVGAASGRVLSPSDDRGAAGSPVVLLSHRGWMRLFNGDPNIVGRSVPISGVPFEIAGVTPESFGGLLGTLLPPNYWAPLSLIGRVRPGHAGREDSIGGLEVIGRLRPGLSAKTARAGLSVWASGGAVAADGRSAVSIQLEPRSTAISLSGEVLLVFSPLFFAFGLVLMIGCANVANLLLARAVSRQREIGVRLSIGASRARLVRQLLTESLLLALAAAAVAFGISRLVLETTFSVVMRTMPPELSELVQLAAPAPDWRVVSFLIVGAGVATVLFGLLPALHATRLDLVRTMRGDLTRNDRPSRRRNALIVMQVTASALLLVCAGVFLRGALRASHADPGLRTADTVVVEINNEPFRTAMVDAIAREASVRAVAALWPELMNRPRAAFASVLAKATADQSGSPEATATRSSVFYRFVSPEYFTVLDIGISRGRVFTQAEAVARAPVVILSERTARQVWPDADALGQALRLEVDPASQTPREGEPELPSRTFTVVGVVRDVAGFRLAGFSEAGVYIPTTSAAAETGLVLRVSGDPDRSRAVLLDRLTRIDPNMGMVFTMRTLGRLEAYMLQVPFWLTVVLGGLALALTLSGIFSVLSYVVEQRTKEIGVRIALGATTPDVMRLVLSHSLRPVGAGLATGALLALGLAMVLMWTPAASQIGTVVDVFDPAAYGVSMLCILCACLLAATGPAARASRVDPMTALRQE